MIVIQGLVCAFGSFRALAGVDLDVARGERVVVCGPSGSGKSTLIRAICGLETPTAGRIVVDGHPVGGPGAATSALAGEIGMVFQQFNLFPHLTVLENVTLAPRKVRGMDDAAARALGMRLLEQVRIPEQADKYPGALSGGQQQRAAIARSLAMQPRVMLFDEPTSALDPEMIREVQDVIVALAEAGMTMIVVTHEMAFARRIADRMVFMDAGEIVEEAPPAVFFAAPRSERARRFLSLVGAVDDAAVLAGPQTA